MTRLLRIIFFWSFITHLPVYGIENKFNSALLNQVIDSFDKTFDKYPDSCLTIGRNILEQSIAAKDSQLIVKSYILIANSYIAKTEYDEGISYLLKAKKVLNQYVNPLLSFKVFKNISLLFYINEKNIEALENINKALDIAKKNNNDTLLARGYLFTANILARKSIAKYDSALILLQQAEELYKKHHINEWGLLYFYYGTTYHSKTDYKQSINYFNKAIDEYQKVSDTASVVATCKELGDIYYFLNENTLALKYYTQAFELQQKIKFQNHESMAMLACDIGYMYAVTNDMTKFRYYEKEANKYAETAIGWLAKYYCAEWFSEIHEKKGNHKESLTYLRQYLIAKDSLLQKESIEKVAKAEADLNTQFKLELTKKEEGQKRQLALQAEKQQRFVRNIFIVCFLIAMVLLFFVFRNYKEKQKANKIIHQQKEEVELKNKEITDSINYAKRIQEAILPGEDQLKQTLQEHFVLYLPKDIVSGDLYWVKQMGRNSLFAAIDCTGHGVPGAFMSILAKNGIDKSVSEMKTLEPDQILTTLDHYIQNSLKKGIHGSSIKDGMDLALCVLDRDKNQLLFSGAMNPLCVIRNGETIFIKGDRFPIGGSTSAEEKTFSKHSLDLQKGDMIYLFSDGYHDQFGGTEGKKLKIKHLKDKLCAIAELPVMEQKQLLRDHIISWRGDHEQVDDILIIGVRA